MKEINEEQNILSEYAKEVKIKMLINKFLYEKLKYLNKYNKITKDIISEFFSRPKLAKKYILDNYQIKIENDNNIFNDEYEKLNDKFNSLFNFCSNDTQLGKPFLLEEKNNNFCLDFIKLENNDIIKALKNSINQSKKHTLYRENIRDNLVTKEKADKEMEKYTTYFQNTMLFELKKCNEFNEKSIKYNLKKNEIIKNINLLNEYISNNKIIKVKAKFNEPQKYEFKGNQKIKRKEDTLKSVKLPKMKNLKEKIEEEKFVYNSKDDYDKNKIKGKNKLIKEFKNIDNLFDTSIQDIDIEQEIHSDDEGIYENKFINKKSLSNNYIKKIHNTIPKLKLGLIEYNKNIINEIDVYSLQRRRFKHKTLQNKIKEMKQKKDNMEITLNNLKKKVDDMQKLNKTINDNYRSIKKIYYQNNSISNINPNLVVNSLNKGIKGKGELEIFDKENEFENNDLDSFLNGIEEVEEEEIIDPHIIEKSDEKKETKEIKKEEEEEKSMDKKNFKSTRKLINAINIFSSKGAFKTLKMQNKILKRTNSK